jgi:hypothetical protein
MRFFIRLIILLISGSTLTHAEGSSTPGYMACARAMGVTISDQFAVLPGESAGNKGLFVYTDRDTYFLSLGVPRSDDGETREYFIRSSLSNVGEIFLIFRENKNSRVPSTIGYQRTPPSTRDQDVYRLTPANDFAGGQANDAMSRRLREKIATVKDFIDDKNSFSTPTEAKVAFEKDRKIYLAKLENCRIEDDRSLNRVVTEEIQKLETGFPGITIWEKQIGGRYRSAQAGR